MFVVATANEDDPSDLGEVTGAMSKWIADSSVFERDERPGHRGMGRSGAAPFKKRLDLGSRRYFFRLNLKNK